MKKVIFALTVSLLCSCTTLPNGEATKTTRLPEALIAASVNAIKAELLTRMSIHGYTLESEHDHILRFSRPLKGMESFGAAVALGNAYSENWRITQYTLIPMMDGSVRVSASSKWNVKLPGGQSREMELADEGSVFQIIQCELDSVKEKLEAVHDGGRIVK